MSLLLFMFIFVFLMELYSENKSKERKIFIFLLLIIIGVFDYRNYKEAEEMNFYLNEYKLYQDNNLRFISFSASSQAKENYGCSHINYNSSKNILNELKLIYDEVCYNDEGYKKNVKAEDYPTLLNLLSWELKENEFGRYLVSTELSENIKGLIEDWSKNETNKKNLFSINSFCINLDYVNGHLPEFTKKSLGEIFHVPYTAINNEIEKDTLIGCYTQKGINHIYHKI